MASVFPPVTELLKLSPAAVKDQASELTSVARLIWGDAVLLIVFRLSQAPEANDILTSMGLTL